MLRFFDAFLIMINITLFFEEPREVAQTIDNQVHK